MTALRNHLSIETQFLSLFQKMLGTFRLSQNNKNALKQSVNSEKFYDL